MTKRRYNKIKSDAEKRVNKIDKFIDGLIHETDGNIAGLLMQRILKKSSEYELDDIRFELEIQANLKTFKIESLVQEIRFDEFLQEIQDNPYQLKLIA